MEDLKQFYELINKLNKKLGSARTLSECSGRQDWPRRGVYFFQEPGEFRTDSGNGLRIVRVGTHALKTGSNTSLWGRLSQHKGQIKNGGGNHRGSIFRLLVGEAMICKHGLVYETWECGSTATREIREMELELERQVSKIIGGMPFLWLSIEDSSGPNSLRGYIECNTIALLSNYNKQSLDPPSENWLGYYSSRERVRSSGLWNQNHVDQNYDPEFLNVLDNLVNQINI